MLSEIDQLKQNNKNLYKTWELIARRLEAIVKPTHGTTLELMFDRVEEMLSEGTHAHLAEVIAEKNDLKAQLAEVMAQRWGQPDNCAITGDKFCQLIKHPEFGIVALYGSLERGHTLAEYHEDGALVYHVFERNTWQGIEKVPVSSIPRAIHDKIVADQADEWHIVESLIHSLRQWNNRPSDGPWEPHALIGTVRRMWHTIREYEDTARHIKDDLGLGDETKALMEIAKRLHLFGFQQMMNFLKDDAIREMRTVPGLRMAAGDHEIYSWNPEKNAWNIHDGGSATLSHPAFVNSVQGPFRIMEDFT